MYADANKNSAAYQYLTKSAIKDCSYENRYLEITITSSANTINRANHVQPNVFEKFATINPKTIRGMCMYGPTTFPSPNALEVDSPTINFRTSIDLNKASKKSTQPMNKTAKKHPLKK